MSKQSSSADIGDSNETSEATLAALTIQISDFVREGTLDSRCAAKLVKQLKKEAEANSECGKGTKPSQKELKTAFDVADATLPRSRCGAAGHGQLDATFDGQRDRCQEAVAVKGREKRAQEPPGGDLVRLGSLVAHPSIGRFE
jgi:hypothetical protein